MVIPIAGKISTSLTGKHQALPLKTAESIFNICQEKSYSDWPANQSQVGRYIPM